MSKLKVADIECKTLPNLEKRGKSDPFVEIEYLGKLNQFCILYVTSNIVSLIRPIAHSNEVNVPSQWLDFRIPLSSVLDPSFCRRGI